MSRIAIYRFDLRRKIRGKLIAILIVVGSFIWICWRDGTVMDAAVGALIIGAMLLIISLPFLVRDIMISKNSEIRISEYALEVRDWRGRWHRISWKSIKGVREVYGDGEYGLLLTFRDKHMRDSRFFIDLTGLEEAKQEEVLKHILEKSGVGKCQLSWMAARVAAWINRRRAKWRE